MAFGEPGREPRRGVRDGIDGGDASDGEPLREGARKDGLLEALGLQTGSILQKSRLS